MYPDQEVFFEFGGTGDYHILKFNVQQSFRNMTPVVIVCHRSMY